MAGMMHGGWSGMNDARAVAAEDSTTDLRRGPWTVEEDLVLINYIGVHGEGRWNSLARCAGLKRTGKSCRLRWLNYLRPDVRRGNITPEEQLLILELHSRWGNRWSKIAQYLPGRTDNEIKNYWRTRVQKHAKQLQCDVNSKQFKDIMRYLWMPRLVERIQAANNAAAVAVPERTTIANDQGQHAAEPVGQVKMMNSPGMTPPPDQAAVPVLEDYEYNCLGRLPEALCSPCRYLDREVGVLAGHEQNMVGACGGNGGDMIGDGSWGGMDDFWLLQQQQL